MEEPKQELKLPMVIAVRTQQSSGSRDRVAAELANYLNYFLADHYDINPFLEKPFPNFQHRDDLSFEILYKMASTQVEKLKIGVVLNAPFISQIHLERLKRLSDLSHRRIILIQCRSPQGEENQPQEEDSDVNGVPKLTVDPMNLFFLEELVSAILPAEKERHLHEFLFFRETKNEPKLNCKRCGQTISSGPSYQCVECDEYSFHKNCAESANDLEYLRKNCPPYLSGRNQPDYDQFPEKQKCKMCGNTDLKNCHNCLFETNMKCQKNLPIILHHKMHAHPLNLIIMPLSYGYEYGCCGCSQIGESISYRCYDCNFNLHVSCCFLPESVKPTAHRHRLVISSQFQGDYVQFQGDNVREEYLCDICKKNRDPEHWSYVCEDCKFVAHIACGLDQPRSSWMN